MIELISMLVIGFALGWFANVNITVNHNHKYDKDEVPEDYNDSYNDPAVKQYFDVKHGVDE